MLIELNSYLRLGREYLYFEIRKMCQYAEGEGYCRESGDAGGGRGDQKQGW